MPAPLPDDVEAALKKLLRRKDPPPRTSTIIEELRREFPDVDVSPEQVRAWAMVLRVTLQRGALPGAPRAPGAGRKKGQVDKHQRATSADEVLRLHIEHPEWTGQQIADQLGLTRAAVSKHLRKAGISRR